VAWVLDFGGAIPIVSNAWTHIAITRSGSTNRAFINGVQLGSNITDSTNWAFTSNAPYIALNAASNNFNGYISNLRVVKGTAVYTSAFTPPTTPLTPIANTALLTCADNRLIDDSINNLTITRSGDTSVQRFSPFNPVSVTPTSYSGYFDGTGDYLTVPSSSNFTFPADFTIEMWLYVPTAYFQTIQRLVSSANPSSPTGACYFSLGNDNAVGAGYLCAAVNLTPPYGAGNPLFSSSTLLPVGQWNHVALVRNGSSCVIYQNGVSVGSATNSATWDLIQLLLIPVYLQKFLRL
jgi:hypothetical protein